jgi:hypothetical protein
MPMGRPGRPSNFSRMIVERALRAAAEAALTRRENITKLDISLCVPPTPGAVRMRRLRSLKRQGAVAVAFVIGSDAIQTLIELGWLDPERRGDRDAVRSAVILLATRALALRIRPEGQADLYQGRNSTNLTPISPRAVIAGSPAATAHARKPTLGPCGEINSQGC